MLSFLSFFTEHEETNLVIKDTLHPWHYYMQSKYYKNILQNWLIVGHFNSPMNFYKVNLHQNVAFVTNH